MKITELRCSACDGTLKLDEKNPNFAVCEYCHTRYMIEWNHPDVAGRDDVQLRRMPEVIPYQRIPQREETKPEQENGKWKKGAALAALAVIVLGVMCCPAVYQRYRADQTEQASGELKIDSFPAVPGNTIIGAEAGGAQQGQEGTHLTGLLAEFAETLFDKPAEDISENELAKIRWLELRSNIDFRMVGYSFEDPLENPEAQLTWMEFPRDQYGDADLSCLPVFSGLKRVNVGQILSVEDLQGLELSGISGYFDSLEEAAAVIETPEQIRYLDITGTPVSLEGIEKFPNLETLILDSDQIDEAKNLVSAKSLKDISVDMYDGSMDFTIFGMMPWLERLSISSESLRDISFVDKMDGLKSFHIQYGTLLTLAPLSGCTELEELSVESCDELKDMSAISALIGLQKMKLDLPYGCPQPDLGSLTGMKELYLEGIDETGFLRNMSQLEALTLDSCSVSSPSDIANLANLKKLSCTSFGAAERDYSFITQLTGLEDLDLHGTITYGDISGIFNLPALKRLNISHMECEINFDRIAENTSLEELSIDSIKLYKNVKVSGGGGIVYVDWDDVSFTEHLAFLEKLQGLKKLSIRENELTDIGFAASLSGLQTIDFADNYVTDLSPLSGLKALSKVDCSENPISNYEILGDSVLILR